MMIRNILNFIYPEKCPFCGRIVTKETGGICYSCREKLPYINEPYCMKCGKPLSDETEEYCYDCKKGEHFFESGRSLWVHKMPVSKAIYGFKYHDLRCYGEVFGREMGKELEDFIVHTNAQVIVPIPLHRKRYLDRGYNQAKVLAMAIGKRMGIPVEELLIRRKDTDPQKVLNDVERRKNIKGAFAAKRPISYERVLLIDDIYTTGSTLDEAAKVLKKAGVRSVYFLTISIGQGF